MPRLSDLSTHDLRGDNIAAGSIMHKLAKARSQGDGTTLLFFIIKPSTWTAPKRISLRYCSFMWAQGKTEPEELTEGQPALAKAERCWSRLPVCLAQCWLGPGSLQTPREITWYKMGGCTKQPLRSFKKQGSGGSWRPSVSELGEGAAPTPISLFTRGTGGVCVCVRACPDPRPGGGVCCCRASGSRAAWGGGGEGSR